MNFILYNKKYLQVLSMIVNFQINILILNKSLICEIYAYFTLYQQCLMVSPFCLGDTLYNLMLLCLQHKLATHTLFMTSRRQN